jgi:iron-sulfur cluster assembly accessory protein
VNPIIDLALLLGVTILVDSKAVFSVLGSTMDYIEDDISSQFTFDNPNVKETCGCGQSFLV